MTIDFPVTLHLFGKNILLHPVLESLGIFMAMRYYFYLKRKSPQKLPFNKSAAVLIGATAGALIGSKIIGNLEKPDLLFSQDFSFVRFWTNNTIVGGLAFGLLGVEWAKKTVNHGESTGDMIVFPLLLAMIIGRVGCFFMGIHEETYGLPTDSVFGMHLGDQFLRHPVALYEIAFLLFMWFELKMIDRKKKYPSGFLFQLFMLSYFMFRFFLDFIKPRVEIFGNLGTIQLVCIFVILYYIYKIKQSIKHLSNETVNTS